MKTASTTAKKQVMIRHSPKIPDVQTKPLYSRESAVRVSEVLQPSRSSRTNTAAIRNTAPSFAPSRSSLLKVIWELMVRNRYSQQ